MKIFEKFPGDICICPICKSDTKDKATVLVPIPGTEDGNIVETIAMHVECLQIDWRKPA